jgi:type VI secretion system Hcp family effector
MKNRLSHFLRNFGVVFAIAFYIVQTMPAKADLITLSLPGITGDVTVAGYQGTIEVMSLTGEVENPVTTGSASSGAGAGKATFGDLMIHKRFDVSSPALFLAVVMGHRFPTAILTFLQGSNNNKLTKVFTMTLSDVLVTKFGTDATEPHVLAGPEQVNLSYGKIILRDEVTGASAGFDRETNTSF